MEIIVIVPVMVPVSGSAEPGVDERNVSPGEPDADEMDADELNNAVDELDADEAEADEFIPGKEDVGT